MIPRVSSRLAVCALVVGAASAAAGRQVAGGEPEVQEPETPAAEAPVSEAPAESLAPESTGAESIGAQERGDSGSALPDWIVDVLGADGAPAAIERETEAWLEEQLALERRDCEERLERLRRDFEVQRAVWQKSLEASATLNAWAEVARLSVELDRERARRLAREEEWYRFTRALAALAPERAAFGPTFSPHAALVDALPAVPEAAAATPSTGRAADVRRALRTLLTVEEVRGLDILSVGEAGDGWTGPVLFRLLDGQGRLAGSLWAERLRLEGSRSGRSLTIVLEQGYEAHAGVRVPFDEDRNAPRTGRESGGVRRIVLPGVDPMPWVDRLPELFGDALPGSEIGDDTWNAEAVRLALNALLAEDAAGGYWRVRQVAAIRADVLREVHLEHLDLDGRVDRHLFADRMSIQAMDRGLQILLQDGVGMRGDRKAAFLDGRYRIFLPKADLLRWRSAGVPGLSEPSAAPIPESPPEPAVAPSGVTPGEVP